MRHSQRLASILIGLLLAFFVASRPASGQCLNNAPAFGVSADLWTSLRPAATGKLPGDRDSSDYSGHTRPDARYPLFSSLDVEGGFLYVTYSTGFQIWNANGANAADPQRLAANDGWNGGFLSWPPGNSEVRELNFDVDVPAGNGNLAATASVSPVGLGIWDTSDKSSIRGIYHDSGRTFYEVYAAVIGGRSYAFGAAEGGAGSGLQVYDMTAATALSTPCVEDATTGVLSCPGVYKGRIGPANGVSYVDGFATPAAKHVIAFSSGVAIRGVALWDVSIPSAPVNLHSGGGRFLGDEIIYGVALWKQGSTSYLALQTPAGGRIYNVTSCLSGACSSLPAPIWSQSWSVSAARQFVTFSRGGASGSTPYLYFGNDNMCSGGPQREWLFDVTTPSAPVEEGTGLTKTVPDDNNNPVVVNYWSSYYSGNPPGFSFVMPRRGKFNGAFFYRSAWSIFDVHESVNVDPTITAAGPATTFAGQAAHFSTQALNCTPAAGGWSWTTDGGSGSSSTSAIDVTWSTTGTKTVTAANTACGAALGETTIEVLDPAPAVGSVTASPATALQCTPITFTANNVTGKPTLSFSWTVKQAGNALPGAPHGSTNPFVWDTTTAAAGTYAGEVTVSGPGGSPALKSGSVTLNPLLPLPSGGGWTPTNDPFAAASVQFHANLPSGKGATEWRWDFGDGTIFQTTDPTTGPNPVHVYAAVDVYTVTLQVRNCQTPTFVQSAGLTVNVVQIAPLAILGFQAQGCLFNPCPFNVNTAITFLQTVTGDPDFYDYDWNGDSNGNCNGNGAFEDSGHTTPVTSHTYVTTGAVQPVLRIRRGATEEVCLTHGGTILISNPQPPPTPSISVSGPSSGTTGTARGFNASASNCTPSASGWTWTTGGGSGSSNTSSIDITWSTTGTKSVTARNSACGSAVGTRSISISDGGTQPLAASYTFSPASPKAGQAVAFDGRASTGNIGTYFWSFGDGATGTGATINHTYAQAGSYTASLSVSEPGCASPSCTRSTQKTLVVTGEGTLGANFTFAPAAPIAGEPTSFDGSGSTGTIGSYAWDFGDGSSGAGVTASHTFAQPGPYQVTLTVASPACLSPSCQNSKTQTVTVGGVAQGCIANDQKLCLLDGRFAVTVHYRDQRSGDTGVGKVQPFPSTDLSGAFWFFGRSSSEILIKVLDGTALPGKAIWVFYGSLTDVEFWLEVIDTQGDADPGNDIAKEYHNLPGTICGVLDNIAFPQLALAPATGGGPAVAESVLNGAPFRAVADRAITGGASGTCVPSSGNLCLLDGRFAVELSYHDQHHDQSGEGTAVAGTDETGYFWFFGEDNLELVVKMVDATGPFGYFWVFWGGTTDLEYTLRVTDTATSDSWETTNPPGSSCGGANTMAFPAP